MKLENHIAYRFLTDDVFWVELLEAHHPDLIERFENKEDIPQEALGFYKFLAIDSSHRPRYVSGTVMEKLEYLKVHRKNDALDWTVFKDVKDGKFTYIFPNNQLVRVVFESEMVHIMLMYFNVNDQKTGDGEANWTLVYADRITGKRCDHADTKEGAFTEEVAYKLLCFIHLSEIEEVVIEKGRKWGTRKQGKIVNSLPFDLVKVDSTWNVTSIRTDGFNVKGHFAIRWTGTGRTVPKVVWINPFQKKGYVRKAKKLID